MLGNFFYILNKREKKTIEEIIISRLSNKYDLKELNRIIKLYFAGMFDHYHEKIIAAYSDIKLIKSYFDKNIQIENLEILNEAFNQNKGVILITAHYGAVEFLPETLSFKGYPLTMIIRFKTNKLKKATLDRANQLNAKVLDPENSIIINDIINHLKQGRVLFTQCDEFDIWRPFKNRETIFLGDRHNGDKTLDVIAKRSKSPAVMALLERRRNGRYCLKFYRISVSNEDDNLTIFEKTMLILEDNIYKHPEQWYQWNKLEKGIEEGSNEDIQNQNVLCENPLSI
ncbi:MAG: hypothetical protein A2X43_08345 [Candidatus Margulisbacteria bacterium GWD2_39_127]|nr:MAG: hypothetical protein A2X43_08345 [Candidatus Margulisbacteria bacterium GWD2_39_127]